MFDRQAAPVSPNGLAVVLGTAVVYALVGGTALLLAGPPGYASALYPSAGIALAAALVWGRVAVAGTLLGSAIVNTGLASVQGGSGAALIVVPWLIAIGAALQAWAGAALVQRFVPQPVLLQTGRDTALAGLLGAGLAGLVSPTVGTTALLATGVLPPAQAGANWLTWWLGDSLGVLIGAPLALAFIGRPREDWRPRRVTLVVPMLVALALVALSMVGLRRAEEASIRSAFERDAERFAGLLQSRMVEPLHALQALSGVARTSTSINEAVIGDAMQWWLAQPMRLQAAGHSPWVARDTIAAFEAEARAAGLAGYLVFDRDDGRARAADGGVVALRHIVPAEGNRAALGVNVLSIPAARAAIESSRRSGLAVASAGFRLTQAAGDETGVVLYQALFNGPAGDEAARRAAFRGVVFVTINTERLLDGLLQGDLGYLAACVIDRAPGATRPRLAGPPGCEGSAPLARDLHTQRPLTLADRPLRLVLTAPPSAVSGRSADVAWLLATAGLVTTAMLGALLLIVTGQTRRTERAVQSATRELRHENSERATAERALRESEERLRNIVDHVPLGVIFVDTQGVLLDCNPSFCTMVGLPLERVRGRSVVSFVEPQDLPVIRKQRRELFAGKDETTTEPVTLTHVSGRKLRVRVIGSALRDSAGRVLRMVGVLEDVTEWLRLQEAERLRERAEAASQAKSDFLSRMSHELRTPLNAMIGFAQLMEMQSRLDPESRHWTQQIQQAGWHLLELINETLDLSRIEAGALQLEPTVLALAPELQAAQGMLAGVAAKQRVTLLTLLDPLADHVRADATRLKQVLTNLLSNAIKYNVAGGRVTLTTRLAADGMVEIDVADSGIGMTTEQLQELFQPYNRLGREAGGIEGTGIGLVISRRLVELMGGTLTARSVAGQGSVFSLRLPSAPRPTAEAVVDPLHAGAPKRVLYVEDNETNIEIMRAVLARRKHIELRTVRQGRSGLAESRDWQPDLILLDMGLPDISGQEVLRKLKTDEDLSATPVIVVSADATPEQIEHALRLGACSYVTKPLAIDPFLELLDRTLVARETQW